MSACNTFTEHVWKPGECKNCFKPKSQHRLAEGGLKKTGPEVPSQEQNHPPTGTRSNTNSSQRGGGAGSSASARSSHFRPPVAKKPTIAVKPTMMLSCSSAGLVMEGNLQRPADAGEPGKTSDFTVWTRNGMNRKRPGGPNNNEGEDAGDEIEGYGHCSHRTPTGNANDNGLTDVLKEIAGLGSCPKPSPLSGSKDLFLGRISSSFQRSLERGLPASGCLAMGSSSGGATQKRVSVSNSMEVISTEGGRFCYPEFSSEGEDDDEDEEHEEDESDGNDDSEHESWDESDEELLAMEIRMRGQPRFANFRAATLSPVPFAQGKKWNTVPLRNRSLQRICAVDYDDSYDEILNGYPSIDSNGGHGHLPYGPADLQGSGFLSNSECTTSPESSSSLPEDSRTTSSCSSGAHYGPLRNGLHSPSAFRLPALQAASKDKEQQTQKDLNPPKAVETHKAVLAIRLEDQDGRECLPMPQALPGQPVTISFSPTEEQAKPYRVVNLEKPLICKPYTVVDVSASMASPEEHNQDRTPKPKAPISPLSFPISPLGRPLSPASPMSPSSSFSHLSITPSAVQGNACKKLGAIRYQEVWTSSTSPRQKIAKVDLGSSTASGPPVPPRYCSHKSAPTSPIAGLSSSRTVPVKSPNLSEIKFNSYNNAGMPPFPIIIRDDTTYFRSSKNAVKVPIVINPSAYDNLAVYKSFLGLSGELSQPKEGRVASHTYEEIGSSESVQPSPTEQTSVCKVASEKAAVDEKKAAAAALISKELTARTTIDSVTVVSIASGAVSPATAVQSPLTVAAILSKSSPDSTTSARVRKISGDTTSSREGSADYPPSSCTGTSHRENASTVLSQIVASIQPPQSCPESPYPSSKAYGIDELYALPLDATKEILSRPKSHFSSTDGCLSKPRKDTPSKQLPKSQSASAAVPLSSPTKSEPNAPFPPPRSTSSPYHASNILQRHFGNWTKPSIASSPTRPSDGETSPGGGEGRRAAESAKPKRWISFKSFFRRRKDDDEQRDKADKGKLVGLDGTVIHMLPPPPIQRHHWFSEAKNEDPNQKPTIIFTYKPDGSASGDGEGELRVEECRETALLSPEASRDVRPLSPGRTPSPKMGTASHCMAISQVPGDANISEGEAPTVTSLPGKLAQVPPGDECASLAVTAASVSEGSASLGDPEEEDGHSHSPTSSSCSATYSNLGQSRANMIPLKHPRNMKSSDDALADLEEEATKATPPPLPKKSVARAGVETSSQGKELPMRPKHEAKPGGTNLSVANPVYDLDSTWETGSHSSSISSEARVHDQESGDSLERPVAVVNKGRGANSLSCLMSAPSATTGRERRGCRSAESLAGRARTTGRGGGGNSKQQRQALYKGMDSWEEVVGRIRGLHTDTLRKLAGKCEDRFMAGQKDHLRFGTDSWSHFRLTTGKPCCEAGDAVYYTASYAKDPLVNYAIKICRSKVKETQQQFFHSLAVRQSLALHFNIQQDCGHFLADVPARLLPWEEEEEEKEGNEEEEDEEGQKGKEDKEISTKKDKKEVVETTKATQNGQAEDSRCPGNPTGTSGHLSSRVVVITREVPFQTVADFVRDGAARHARNPDLYERQVCLLLLQLCSGLEHMKPYHVTHCDLRLENLLLVHCQPGNAWNLDLLEPNNNSSNSASSGAGAANAAANATCPARLIISNFSQAKQKNPLAEDPGALRDQSRLAPEIVTATQYRKCDEFQTGILIYEMLHRPNPFEETPELKEREYTWADLPPLPARSLYSQGLQQLASLLLTVNPSERIQMAEARTCLQCLLWGPREDLFQALSSTSGPISGVITSQRETTLQNWLDLKRTLMMIKFAERSLDTGCGVSLEDWLCCQYLAFATTDSLSRVVRILQQQNPRTQHTAQSQNLAQSQNVFKSQHLSQSQQHITHTEHITHSQPL